MRHAGAAFVSALGYFTTLPVFRAAGGAAPDAFALSFLPFIGMVTGALAGLAAWGAALIVPHPFVVGVAFAASLLVTGAIHVDGFLDSCDALFATASPQRRLEIMKDPRHGTFAVAGMSVLLVFWIAALWPFEPSQYPLVLAFSGGSARLAAVLMAFTFSYARGGASAQRFETRPSVAFLVPSGLLLAAAALALPPAAIVALPVCLLAAQGTGLACSRRLGGGLTGDVYGFVIVIFEVAVLMAFSVHRF